MCYEAAVVGEQRKFSSRTIVADHTTRHAFSRPAQRQSVFRYESRSANDVRATRRRVCGDFS